MEMDRMNGMDDPGSNPEALSTRFYSYVKENSIDYEQQLDKLGLNSEQSMLAASQAYISLRCEYPGIAFHDDAIPRTFSSVSDAALSLIDEVVKERRVTNRYDVMSEVCETLESRYGDGAQLEARLRRMNLNTTSDILHAIDMYFVMLRLYPDTIFARGRGRKAG